MPYNVEIVLDSASQGVRLTTFLVTFPRIILAEVNTHRMLSRSYESSRAVPIEKRITAAIDDPFVPKVFARNRRGMQAGEPLDPVAAGDALRCWLDARDAAVFQARLLAGLGVHKQLANRILEPFSWVTGVLTATQWDNFFALRCHPAGVIRTHSRSSSTSLL